MESEFLQLARDAAAALQLQAAGAGSTRWVEITQAAASVVGVGCIVWGLFQMQAAGKRRDRALDQQAETLGKIGQGITELLRRP